MRYVASVSFGKDSLAMLLRLIAEEKPLDEVVFYDTGMEFDCIYKIRDFIVENYLKPLGIKYTELKPKYPFEYMMFEQPINGKKGLHYGYSWCGGCIRWGTGEKIRTIQKYTKEFKHEFKHYVGIAVDEPKRIERAKLKGQLLPLVDWKMTEEDCLKYCYEKGFYWEENGIRLYDVLDRVSCWCCANKNKKELLAYYKHLPRYWNRLKDYQSKTYRPFKKDKTIFDFEDEFKGEK